MSEKASMDKYKITVIMPALNEELCLEGGVANVMDGFERYGVNGELIIVNDGSSDRTAELAVELARIHNCIKVLHHKSPEGIGACFRDAMLHAGGEMVVYLPGDGENDASEILRYLPLIDHVDIVVPFVINPGVRSWRRQLLSSAYHKIIYLTSSLSLNYMNGNVIYRKSILSEMQLKSRGFFYQAEILIKTIGSGYLYAEVPYIQRRRIGGVSKSTTFSSLFEVARAYCVTMLDMYSSGDRKLKMVADSVTAQRLEEMSQYTGVRK